MLFCPDALDALHGFVFACLWNGYTAGPCRLLSMRFDGMNPLAIFLWGIGVGTDYQRFSPCPVLSVNSCAILVLTAHCVASICQISAVVRVSGGRSWLMGLLLVCASSVSCLLTRPYSAGGIL